MIKHFILFTILLTSSAYLHSAIENKITITITNSLETKEVNGTKVDIGKIYQIHIFPNNNKTQTYIKVVKNEQVISDVYPYYRALPEVSTLISLDSFSKIQEDNLLIENLF